MGALLRRLANALCKQGVILAQVRANHQSSLQLRQTSNRSAQPAHAFINIKLRIAQAPVDVIAADAAQQLTRKEQLFESTVGADQGTDAVRTVLFLDLL